MCDICGNKGYYVDREPCACVEMGLNPFEVKCPDCKSTGSVQVRHDCPYCENQQEPA